MIDIKKDSKIVLLIALFLGPMWGSFFLL
jgi:hypothetical protein